MAPPTSRAVVAVFIAANALTAGSIFCFPLFGPKMAADLGLSLTQTNTIWSAAVVGQYASAAVIGWAADTYGPRPVSLLAAALFGAGYILMARTESDAIVRRHSQFLQGGTGDGDKDMASHMHATFVAMAVYFVLVGAGVAASIFSALRASTAHFKSHPGLALSIPLTLFSLSSLFLSAFASLSFFTDPKTGDLNSPRWLATLGAVLMIVNTLSAFGLSVPDTSDETHSARADDSTAPDERAPLLGEQDGRPNHERALLYSTPRSFISQGGSTDFCIEPKLTLGQFLCAPATWTLAFTLFAAVGGAEMVMSSIGSMVVSLTSSPSRSTAAGGHHSKDNVKLGKEILALRMQQVQLLAIANTIARLAVGFVSDLLSPAIKEAPGASRPRRSALQERFRVSRITLLMAGLLLLCATFAFAATRLSRVDQLWIVSLATGAGYGLTFTLVPSVIICVWPAQFGRNYGLLTYAAALGSLCFSMLFARVNDAVAAAHNGGSGDSLLKPAGSSPNTPTAAQTAICTYGRACFAPSFALAAIVAGLGAVVLIPLWRAWHRVL